MTPRFFKTPADFRAWLATHHGSAKELLVGFYKKGTGKPSITWPESVDEALCVGWIDGIRRRIDEESYSIRFTPRQRRSIWSNVNTKRVAVLTRERRMLPAGLAAFAKRDPKRSGVYSFERETAAFAPDVERAFRANARAWAYWTSTGRYYQRVVTHWATSAKKEETCERRFAVLVSSCEKGEKIPGYLQSSPTPKPAKEKRKAAGSKKSL
jgi:uncharacterized protein YdeI (YjbR/CyaY-like superfamily)